MERLVTRHKVGTVVTASRREMRIFTRNTVHGWAIKCFTVVQTNTHMQCLTARFPVTVTESFVLRPPTEDREHITKQSSVSFPVSADRLEQNVFSWRWKVFVDRSRSSTVSSLFLACGAATEKALLPIRNQISPIIQRVTTQKSYMAACSLLLVARLDSDV